MTLSQALDYLRYRMNEQGAASSYWADMELYQLISARAQIATSQMGLIEAKDTSTTTVASTQEYDWPTTAAAIVKVLYDGRLLQELSFREWELEKQSGVTPTGQPMGYVLHNRKIILVPTPDAAETLTIYQESYHPWIDAGTDTIDLDTVLHPALMDGVLADMSMKAQNIQMATFYENKWTGHLQSTFPNFQLRKSQRSRAGVLIDSDTSPATSHGLK